MENLIGPDGRRTTLNAEADLYESGPPLPEGLTRWSMYVMSRVVQRGWVLLARGLAEAGLSPRTHALLVVVQERQPVSQQVISEVLRVDRTTTMAIADAAEDAGLISRDRDQGDRRRYALRLTEAGEQALEHGDRLVARVHDELFSGLDADERATLRSLLLRAVPTFAGSGVPVANANNG
jgi:MarR family transcriptional regulator, lower aerobic nicotinate degradation pathway regulator